MPSAENHTQKRMLEISSRPVAMSIMGYTPVQKTCSHRKHGYRWTAQSQSHSLIIISHGYTLLNQSTYLLTTVLSRNTKIRQVEQKLLCWVLQEITNNEASPQCSLSNVRALLVFPAHNFRDIRAHHYLSRIKFMSMVSSKKRYGLLSIELYMDTTICPSCNGRTLMEALQFYWHYNHANLWCAVLPPACPLEGPHDPQVRQFSLGYTKASS